MTLLDQLRSWLKREKSDVDQAWRETETRLNADLSRKERQLNESPEERLARTQAEIEATDDPFQEIRRRVQGNDDHG